MHRHLIHGETSASGTVRFRTVLYVLMIAAMLSATFADTSLGASSKNEKTPSLDLVGDGIEFASEIVDGVLAKVHISDVRGEMKKLNSAKTHLIAIKFYDAATNKPIDKGNAALYLTSDHDKTGFFDPMKNEEGIFVAGLLLVKKGMQHAIIATKLRDRKTRDFHVHFKVQ